MNYTVKEAVGLFAHTHPHHLPVDQVLDETKLGAFAQRTIILKAGRIIADAPTDELRQRGRTAHMSIAVPEESGPGLVEELRNANPQWKASYEGGRVHATGRDMDDAARIALAHPGAHDISVTASTLEDVFTELTA